MQSDTKIHRFSNGVRLATVSMPHMESVAIGLWTSVGSRHESPGEHGMAHFIEHLLFRGTPSRTAEDISRQIEGLGGTVDGFTVEDHTCYHAKAPADQLELLLDVLTDFYQNPVFDPWEIEAERRIIREEIAMVHDQPAQHLEDLVSQAAWGADHSLGRSITGTEESLAQFTRPDVFDFFKRSYSGCQTVISVAGKIDHFAVAETVEQKMEKLPAGSSVQYEPAPPIARRGHSFGKYPSREQAHVALAFRSADRHDPDRYAQKLLNVMLGENMSSRLFQHIREQLGLCYEVQSDLVAFSDAGLLQIYLALDPENLSSALHAVSGILDNLCRHTIADEELDQAKRFIGGQSRIGLENTSSQMMWAGESLLSFDKWIDPDKILEKLDSVTIGDVQSAARKLFLSGGLSTSLAGSPRSDAVLREWAAKYTRTTQG